MKRIRFENAFKKESEFILNPPKRVRNILLDDCDGHYDLDVVNKLSTSAMYIEYANGKRLNSGYIPRQMYREGVIKFGYYFLLEDLPKNFQEKIV